MKCNNVRPKLLEYSKALVSDEDAVTIAEHLAVCSDCSAMLDDEIAMDTLLNRVEQSQPDRDLWLKVASRVSTPARGSLFGLLNVHSRFAKAAGALAVTAALVAVLTVQFKPDSEIQKPAAVSVQTGSVSVNVRWVDDPVGDDTEAMFEYIEQM